MVPEESAELRNPTRHPRARGNPFGQRPGFAVLDSCFCGSDETCAVGVLHCTRSDFLPLVGPP